MTEKSKTWRSSTTTRSWSMSGNPPTDAGDAMEALRRAGDGARMHVSEQWRYAGDDADGPFQVEIKDGVVTVNGQRYDSLEAVPRADRERIEAVRHGLNDSGLWDALRDAGIDIGGLAGPGAPRAAGKPEFIMETDIPDVRSVTPAATPTPHAESAPRVTEAPAPGAVPRGVGGLRRIVLITVALGLAWWILRLTGAA
ncbi:hypothetical protein HGQ98_24755 [Achromobacter ruhlandii]|uniref:Uncharacterized protein n=1 Tax=Achromobacter ruhlandii TaxID=72557 RepID=A0A848NQI1_9BURK|nr:hypothetical protein [Achromobacter ruhlandii]NMU92781.1 hypothetical protein [Achromobacter ruhlandii]